VKGKLVGQSAKNIAELTQTDCNELNSFLCNAT